MRIALFALGIFAGVVITLSNAAPVVALGLPGPIVAGVATWYDDGPGLYGATPEYDGTPYVVQVCEDVQVGTHACVTVTVRDYCACGDRGGKDTVIDLSPAAFRRLAPLSVGVLPVIVTYLPAIELPATDTAGGKGHAKCHR